MNKICAKCLKNEIGVKLYTLQKCRHIFCEKCLYEHVKNEFYKLNSCKIKCPLTNCDKAISDRDIRKFLPTNCIEQYEKLQIYPEAVRKCLTKNCPYICKSDGDLIFKCEYCDQPNCTKCKKRHYPNQCEKNEDHEEIREQSAQEAIRQRKRKEIEAYDLNSDLVPNFDGFVCPICEDFFLPNTQVMLRTCQHEFCLTCLKETLKLKKSFPRLNCPECNATLTPVELKKLVGKTFIDSLNTSVIRSRLYNCKYEDCNGLWDLDPEKKGDYECPVCGNKNCISCGVVHKKHETCSKFQDSQEYKDYKKEVEISASLKQASDQCFSMMPTRIEKMQSDIGLENQFDTIFKSLNEKYDKINDLEISPINDCLEIVNNFCENDQFKIIDYLKNNTPLENYQKLCLNCLHLSINLISKYIEKHRPSISVDDCCLISVFNGFFDMISSHHLVERICEAILYTMCSIMSLEGKKPNELKDKLELCFYNDKISEEIKLASSVILVQLNIANFKLICEIAEYLFKHINIDYCEEDFGFTQSEINSARKSTIMKLYDNCKEIKVSSPSEICSKIGCNETHLNEIQKFLNEIRNESHK